jgi:hypothetical protein
MNYFLMLAGGLSILIGLIHSILGELLIFNKLRKDSIVANLPCPPLRGRNVRILWAAWHLASLFGFCIGAILIQLSFMDVRQDFIVKAISISMLLSAALVAYSTKAKHPGWIGLLGVSVLCWLA